MNVKSYSMIIGMLLMSLSSSALQLKSTPLFGVRGVTADTGQGVVVQGVLPASTATKVGLLEGDVIIELNGQQVSDFQQLIAMIQTMKVGENIAIKVDRGDQQRSLTGQILSRPQEQHAHYEVIYDAVKYKNNLLRSMVYKPADLKAGEKRLALYYIQGYTCQSIDAAMTPDLTLQHLLNQVVLKGYVVYKIEKFGVGDSAGDLKCSQVDFTQEMNGFLAGMNALKKYEFVDENNVFVFGHSLGGVYAPIMAEQATIRGIAVYGAVVKSWYDYLLDIFSEQAVIFGTAAEQAKSNTERLKPLLQAWLKSDRSWGEIQNDAQYKAAFEANLIPVQGDQVFHRHYSFFRDLNRYDLKAAWRNYQGAVFAMHGEYDIQAISDDWAKDLTALVNQSEPGVATMQVFANTDHGLMKYSSMQALQADMSAGRYNPVQPREHLNPEVGEQLIQWMEKVLAD